MFPTSRTCDVTLMCFCLSLSCWWLFELLKNCPLKYLEEDLNTCKEWPGPSNTEYWAVSSNIMFIRAQCHHHKLGSQRLYQQPVCKCFQMHTRRRRQSALDHIRAFLCVYPGSSWILDVMKCWEMIRILMIENVVIRNSLISDDFGLIARLITR